jgi:hypothetical protein
LRTERAVIPIQAVLPRALPWLVSTPLDPVLNPGAQAVAIADVCGNMFKGPVIVTPRRRLAKKFVQSRSDPIADVPGPLVEAFPVPLAILGLRTKGGLVAIPLGLQALVAKVLLAIAEVRNPP